jgi:hypothetical protein
VIGSGNRRDGLLRGNKTKKIFVLSLLIILFCAAPVFAFSAGMGKLNLPGYDTVKKIKFYLLHRAAGDVTNRPFDNMIATYGVGFRITDWADLSILRSDLNQEFYVSNKIKFFDGFAFLWGVSNKTSPLITKDKTNYVAQLIFSEELFKDKLAVTFVPTYSNILPERPTFAIGMGANLAIIERYSYFENVELLGEYIPAFGGYAFSGPELAVGIRCRVLGQVISLMITNVLYTFPNGYILGNEDGAFHLGFNFSVEL